jgi:hypothetical protein
MKNKHKAGILLTLVALLLLTGVAVHAQVGGGYDLTWSTVDGGGATFSTGGGYSLGGTIGQPDAGAMTGGAYTLAGGFWDGAATYYHIYLPLVWLEFQEGLVPADERDHKDIRDALFDEDQSVPE